MSSLTNICPSQFDDDPIPIVGIFSLFVINLAAKGDKHSKTIEKAPACSIFKASLRSLPISTLF